MAYRPGQLVEPENVRPVAEPTIVGNELRLPKETS